MPSNKDKVTSYLEDDESLALSNFCKEKGCSGSQGVSLLIRKHRTYALTKIESYGVKEQQYEEDFR
jgi:hypothetical protein